MDPRYGVAVRQNVMGGVADSCLTAQLPWMIWKRIWWAPRESNPAPTNYEFAALTKHELGAQMRSKACYLSLRQQSRAGIVTTKTTEETNATGITWIPAAFASETLENQFPSRNDFSLSERLG